MDLNDPVMTEMGAAVERGRAGDREEARIALHKLWERVGADGDALHRCSIAHYTADLQESVADELRWDERALAAADPTDERFHGFLPSLQLNLADAHRRAGNADRARHHLAAAAAAVDVLPDDEYGRMIRGGIERNRAALAEIS